MSSIIHAEGKINEGGEGSDEILFEFMSKKRNKKINYCTSYVIQNIMYIIL
jgi:hypothetical protein